MVYRTVYLAPAAFSPAMRLDLYTKIVRPSLLYGAEIWGCAPRGSLTARALTSLASFENQLYRSLILKSAAKSAASAAVHAELGTLPAEHHINRSILEYYAYLLRIHADPAPPRRFSILADVLRCWAPVLRGIKGTWFHGAEHLWSCYLPPPPNTAPTILPTPSNRRAFTPHTPDLPAPPADPTAVRRAALGQAAAEHTYSTFSGNRNPLLIHKKLLPAHISPYLHYHIRHSLIIRFRLSLTKLPIEIGRHRGTTRAQRVCKLCREIGEDALGDEQHYINICPFVTPARDRFDLGVGRIDASLAPVTDDVRIGLLRNCDAEPRILSLLHPLLVAIEKLLR